MKTPFSSTLIRQPLRISAVVASMAAMLLASAPQSARASQAYGSINNFDTVNDTGHECHGFEIELDDIHSKNITYTYNYNHYGVPEITEDLTDPVHPKTFIRWQSKKNANGTWAAYTAIPSGPIAPTNGHMFTNPAVNFGGEHFGAGYTMPPSAVLYNWLIDNGSGVLVRGGAVQVSTPTFTYYPPVAAQPAKVVAVIVPPPPPAPPPKEFGKAVWVKEIKTTSHNPEKIKLRELVSADPDHPEKKNWANGEPDEVEVEWRILQKKTSAVDGGPNNNVAAAPENLPGGNEVVTRRYEFYKYTGPLDAETNEAMADAVGADGSHGTGTRTYATRFDNATGEWVVETLDMATFVIVGDFTGSQMAAVDVDAAVGLIDHVGEGKVNKAFAPRTVVVEGSLPFFCTHDGAVPPGMTFDDVTGILSGTPTTAGQYQFSITASDGLNPDVQKNYTMSVAAVGAALPAKSLLDTTVSPVGAGTTSGDGTFDPGTNATAGIAGTTAGYAFVNWTDNGQVVSTNPNYTLVMDVNHSLVANFVPAWTITTSSLPVAGGTTSGGGNVNDGDSVTVVATANAGYTFVNWTEAGVEVSALASYTFTATGDRDLVANFTNGLLISSSASPAAGGSTSGGGAVAVGSSVTVSATANAGYVFVNWTENGTQVSANASYTFTATVSRTLVANFTLAPSYTVSTSSSPAAGGTTSGGGSYASGTSATVTATANAGYNFVNWTVGGAQVSTSPSYTFNVTANRSLVANFIIVGGTMRTVTTSSSPTAGGTTSGAGAYANGSSVTVVATPNAGYKFSKWKEGGSTVSSSASYTFTVTANRTLVASFTQAFVVTALASPVAGGTTEMDSTSYKLNETAKAKAFPNAGYNFVSWTENGTVVSTDNPWDFNVTGDRTITANFASANGVTITASSAPANGGTTSGGGGYAIGANVTLNATPNAGFAFSNWTDGGTVVSNSASYSFAASANRALVANFVSAIAINTASNPAAGGTTSGGGSFASGASVTLTATPNAGYAFTNWTEGAVVVSTSPSFTFTASAPRTLTANFAQGWTITTSASPALGGTITGGGSVADGASVTLIVTANPGYQFAKWTEGGADVSTNANYSFTATADRTLVATFTLSSGGVKFDFDTGATAVALGQAVPLDQMSAGITAYFTSAGADAFTIGDAATTGKTFAAFSGKYLVPGADGSTLDIAFTQQIAAISLKFALSEALNLGSHSTLRITAFDNSSGAPLEVGSATAQGTNTAGDSLAGGTLSLNTGALFDTVRIEVLTAAQAGATFYCDNIAVTPTSTGGWQVLANPNWNITLTDSGYSDYLIDNTPGFEGREYLSGEWGAAVAYKVGGSSKSPRWMEPNFAFPDWQTNSNFHVVTPITLIASNADGLPIAQSVIANNDIEITIRYEMIDTVTGIPMGITAASAGGAGASIDSNRYVLNQSYTVKNISGAAITNLQVFQMLHGFTSTAGVYDSRTYAGKHSDYRYDATLSGVDGGTIGAPGSSASGLKDYIGFSGKVAPSAFEIGYYGIQSNGIDDHATGKPSDGVHLSIENNWGFAPYSTRRGTDSFAPASPWVAGAQRYELGAIADGQSVTIDVMLSILTGTTVSTGGGGGGGGGNHGTGSCNGGSSHVGGVDFDIEGVENDGTFFGEEAEADDDEIAERIADGEFVLPNFAEPGGLSQVWNLQYTGTYSGKIKLTFAYDPALLPVGFDQTKLTIYHYHAGAWEQLVGLVDPVAHTITVMTDSLSPFMLGVPSANAIPKMAQATGAPAGQVKFNWSSDTTGWVLQESADLVNWVNSVRPVTTVGGVSSVNANSSEGTCFFRLVHP